MHFRSAPLRASGSQASNVLRVVAAALVVPLLTLGGAGAASALPVVVATASAPSNGQESSATIAFSPENSGVSRPGESLTVSGKLSNTGSSSLASGRIVISVGRDTADVQGLQNAWADPSALALQELVAIDAPPLAVAGTVQLSAIIPADVVDAALGGTGWGAHVVVARYDNGSLQASSTSALVRLDGDGPSPIPVSVILPITASTSAEGLLDAEQLSLLTASDGELTNRLVAAKSSGATLALDPRIVASIRVLGDAAPASAVDWLAQLESLPNDVFPLQYGDADPGLEVNAGRDQLLEPTSFASALKAANFTSSPGTTPTSPTPSNSTGSTPGPTPSPTNGPNLPSQSEILAFPYTRSDVAWPASGTIGGETIERLANLGLTTTIVSEGQFEGASAAAADVAGRTALVADSLSGVVSDAVYALDNSEARLEASRAAALLASTAKQGTSPSVLIALDRDDEAGTNAGTRLEALSSLPWVSRTSVAAAAGQPTNATLIPADDFRVAGFGSMLDDEARVGAFSSVLSQPDLLTGSARLDLLASIQAGRSSDPEDWNTLVAIQSQRASETLDSVSIDDSSQINVLSYSAGLPVNISNALPYPVTVRVVPRASNGRLNISDNTVTIDPESTGRISLDAKAIANGRVTVDLQMVSPTGVPVGSSRELQLELSPFVETAGIAVIGALILGLLGFGTFRSIRRGIRTRKADSI